MVQSFAILSAALLGTTMGVNVGKLVFRIAGMAVTFSLALFLPAGTLVWPAGWTYLVLVFGFTAAVSTWLLRSNPDLLGERMTGIGHPGQKTGDKVFLALTAPTFFAWLVVMAAVAAGWRVVPGHTRVA